MTDGYLLVDKPTGPTSHDVVAAVRRAVGVRRVGHTGTLDPFASGLLPVLVGRGTRLARFLSPLRKTYTGVLRLGRSTDTLDSTGATVAEFDGVPDPGDAELAAAFASLTGSIQQTPPSYSAKKIAGVPAHRRMRRGESVTLDPVTVTVHRFVVTGRSGPDVSFEVDVSAGTYIRALARDVGERLGVGAHLTGLRRTRVGTLDVADAIPLDRLGETELLPLAGVLVHLPTIAIDRNARADVIHGKSVPGFAGAADGTDPVALTCDGDLVAVAEAVGESLHPRVVVAE